MNAPTFFATIALTLSALPAQLPTSARATATATSPPANYVVHEWGTFTSMVDAKGFILDGLHHEEEHLPAFVHDLSKIDEAGRVKGVKLPASYVTQKMETPVIYFYAEEPLRAQVRVWFANGLMTQFYPLPATIHPRVGAARRALVDMRQVRASMLTWDVDVLARGTDASKVAVPSVPKTDPWHFARQTRANLVRTRPPAAAKAKKGPPKAEAEHYLFYRGLGRWQPDVLGSAAANGRLTFENRMGEPIPFCIALQLGERGGRFATGRALGPRSDTARFDLSKGEWIADRERFARRVGAEVLRALVAAGLYADEARAMVATWSRSWFQSDGTRVIYLLPRAQVDQVLVLALDPQPRELVRVMVGRHELITPEAQATVERALAGRLAADPMVAEQAEQELARLDRFLEPHLRNVAHNGTSQESRERAANMLATRFSRAGTTEKLPPR
ncbi:MAG: hypothetical protein NXI31_06930 [bacterium]|nr:hypothetical protein [bacterium]